MYKRILAPIDGSDISLQAVRHAINLAKEQQAKLCILNVIEEYMPSTGDSYIDIEKFEIALNNYSQDILKNAENLARESSVDVELKSCFLEPLQGRVPDKIIEVATTWAADLIVIGSHGRHGVQRLLLGSVADAVIHITTIPLLLIHGESNNSLTSVRNPIS
jgi:nucleotide-binding universal stress UspA family protein